MINIYSAGGLNYIIESDLFTVNIIDELLHYMSERMPTVRVGAYWNGESFSIIMG